MRDEEIKEDYLRIVRDILIRTGWHTKDKNVWVKHLQYSKGKQVRTVIDITSNEPESVYSASIAVFFCSLEIMNGRNIYIYQVPIIDFVERAMTYVFFIDEIFKQDMRDAIVLGDAENNYHIVKLTKKQLKAIEYCKGDIIVKY